jgi:hypothetical protein
VSLRRELLEEIGYEANLIEPIATFYVSPGGSSERIRLFYVEVSDPREKGAGRRSAGRDRRHPDGCILGRGVGRGAQARRNSGRQDAGGNLLAARAWMSSASPARLVRRGLPGSR